MNEHEELLRKWQLKKIATLAFINDECDDMKPKDRKAFYNMMETIFGEIVIDLKNLALPHVINAVCKHCGMLKSLHTPSGICKDRFTFFEQTDL